MGFHRKAGFHWTKKGLSVFEEMFAQPLIIGDKGVLHLDLSTIWFLMSDLFHSWENVYVRPWRNVIFDFATLQ